MNRLILTAFLTSFLAFAEDPVTLEIGCSKYDEKVTVEVSGKIDEGTGKGTLYVHIDHKGKENPLNSEMAAERLSETSVGLLELSLKDNAKDLSTKLAVNLEKQTGTLSILSQEFTLTCHTMQKRTVRFSYVNESITSGLLNFSIAEVGLADEVAKICPNSKNVLTDEIRFKITGCGVMSTENLSPFDRGTLFENQETFTPVSYFRCYPQVKASAVVACKWP